jgi:hypothetical protein
MDSACVLVMDAVARVQAKIPAKSGTAVPAYPRTYLANAEIALFGNDLGDTFAFHRVKHIFSSGTQPLPLA